MESLRSANSKVSIEQVALKDGSSFLGHFNLLMYLSVFHHLTIAIPDGLCVFSAFTLSNKDLFINLPLIH